MRANIKKRGQCRFLFYILHKSHYEYITIYTEIYLIEFLFHFMKFYFSSFDCVYMHIISLNMFFTFSLSLKKNNKTTHCSPNISLSLWDNYYTCDKFTIICNYLFKMHKECVSRIEIK